MRRERLRRQHLLKVAISVASMEITGEVKEVVQDPRHVDDVKRRAAKFALSEQALLLAIAGMLSPL